MNTSTRGERNRGSRSSTHRKRHGVRVTSLAIAVVAVAAAVAYQRSGVLNALPPQAQGDAVALRQMLVDKAAGRSPQYTIHRIREGIERFFISDINNPAATAIAQSESCPRRGWASHPRRHVPNRVMVSVSG